MAEVKEKIEKEILKAMKSVDEIQHLIHQLPEEEGYSDFLSELTVTKRNLKYYLNIYFDRLARQRKEGDDD